MSSNLVPILHQEERTIVAELRASKPFQRLEAIRRLLALYDAQPSVATGLDVPVTGEADRAGGEVISFAATTTTAAPPQPVYTPAPPAAQSAPVASAIPLPGPAAAAVPAASTQVAAMAEAAVADVVMRSPAPAAPIQAMEHDSSSVVSSVRAALLGIGKG